MTAEKKITIVLASDNPHKLRELRAMLVGLPVELVLASRVVPSKLHVVEDGLTFEENARKKGQAAMDASRMLALADDSGLEVDALGGRPGVRSARFAHEKATDAENNAALLAALEEVDDEARTARFRCALALFDPWAAPGESPIMTEGSVEGRIARVARGGGGFGYDPLFLVDELGGRSMAELTEDEKNGVSHRARAVRALLPRLRDVVLARLADVERVSETRPSIGAMLRPK